MVKVDFDEALTPLLARDARYHRDAYHFVRSALDHTHKLQERKGNKGQRHVTGQELLEGIRDLALEEYGPMAMTVLNEWGVQRCEDFGEIVFNLVDAEILRKTENDSREDFRGGYDFFEVFRRPYLPQCRQRSPEVEPLDAQVREK